MGGHVFVVHGDLTHLACDDWLVPSDRDLTLTEAWLPVLAEDAVRRSADGVPQLAIDAPAAFCDGTRRVLPVPDEARRAPADGSPHTRGRPWLLDVGEDAEVDAEWLVDGVRAWLDAVPDGKTERSRPLLGLPLVGTGAGGAAGHRDDVLAALLPALPEDAARAGADVALVLNDERDHAAAQDVRRRLANTPWPFDDDQVQAADALATRAAAGQLALFLGAGV